MACLKTDTIFAKIIHLFHRLSKHESETPPSQTELNPCTSATVMPVQLGFAAVSLGIGYMYDYKAATRPQHFCRRNPAT